MSLLHLACALLLSCTVLAYPFVTKLICTPRSISIDVHEIGCTKQKVERLKCIGECNWELECKPTAIQFKTVQLQCPGKKSKVYNYVYLNEIKCACKRY